LGKKAATLRMRVAASRSYMNKANSVEPKVYSSALRECSLSVTPAALI